MPPTRLQTTAIDAHSSPTSPPASPGGGSAAGRETAGGGAAGGGAAGGGRAAAGISRLSLKRDVQRDAAAVPAGIDELRAKVCGIQGKLASKWRRRRTPKSEQYDEALRLLLEADAMARSMQVSSDPAQQRDLQHNIECVLGAERLSIREEGDERGEEGELVGGATTSIMGAFRAASGGGGTGGTENETPAGEDAEERKAQAAKWQALTEYAVALEQFTQYLKCHSSAEAKATNAKLRQNLKAAQKLLASAA